MIPLRVFFSALLLMLMMGSSITRAQSSGFTNQLLNADELLRVVITNAFDTDKSCSGVAMIHMDDKEMPMDIELGVAAQDGDVRFYLDKANVKGDPIFVLAAKDNLRRGLTHVVTLFKKGDTNRYTIFPDRRMFKHANEPLAMFPPIDVGGAIHFEISQAGTETVDMHPCRKLQVRGVTKESSRVMATIWKARDLDNAPLKAVLDVSQDVTILMRQVRTTRLNTNLFAVPTGYREFKGSYFMPEFTTLERPNKK